MWTAHELEQVVSKVASKQSLATPAVPGNPVNFHCPACNSTIKSSSQAFQLIDLDKTCKCKSCRATNKVKDWKCGCRLPWHLCAIHRVYANDHSKKPPSSVSSARQKRPVWPLTAEQLQELDTKRTCKSRMQPIPPAPNILSAKLRERFAYLFRD